MDGPQQQRHIGREGVPSEQESTRFQIETGIASTNRPRSFLPLLGGVGGDGRGEGESQRLVCPHRRGEILGVPPIYFRNALRWKPALRPVRNSYPQLRAARTPIGHSVKNSGQPSNPSAMLALGAAILYPPRHFRARMAGAKRIIQNGHRFA